MLAGEPEDPMLAHCTSPSITLLCFFPPCSGTEKQQQHPPLAPARKTPAAKGLIGAAARSVTFTEIHLFTKHTNRSASDLQLPPVTTHIHILKAGAMTIKLMHRKST